MQQLYVLRRFSSWSFRLSVSMALLLSSAGLAASLLVGAATSENAVSRLAWQPRAGFSQVASELAATQRASSQALPVSLSSMVPTYSFATSAGSSGQQLRLVSGDFSNQDANSETTPLSTTHTLKTTVQRSWDTFKLAFR